MPKQIASNSPRKAVKNLPEAILAKEEGHKPFNFKEDVNWRIFRILAEFINGFEFLAPLKKEVTFFGSARFNQKNQHYQQARDLASMLGGAGFSIITGGGPGIMEAANQGAYEAGAESIGINIQLPFEQRTNPYVKRSEGFHYFFVRKVILSISAQAYIFFPGGLGTLDEFFEIITLIQTRKMEPVPVVLIGKDFFAPLIEWLRTVVLAQHQCISKEDLEIFHLVDTVQEAFELVNASHEKRYF